MEQKCRQHGWYITLGSSPLSQVNREKDQERLLGDMSREVHSNLLKDALDCLMHMALGGSLIGFKQGMAR